MAYQIIKESPGCMETVGIFRNQREAYETLRKIEDERKNEPDYMKNLFKYFIMANPFIK